jgi:hypothetical protein
MKKYKINSKGTEEIDISVLNVNRNDGGIYQLISPSGRHNVDGCCLLIITGWYYLVVFHALKPSSDLNTPYSSIALLKLKNPFLYIYFLIMKK